jgi:hypothetical protein
MGVHRNISYQITGQVEYLPRFIQISTSKPKCSTWNIFVTRRHSDRPVQHRILVGPLKLFHVEQFGKAQASDPHVQPNHSLPSMFSRIAQFFLGKLHLHKPRALLSPAVPF